MLMYDNKDLFQRDFPSTYVISKADVAEEEKKSREWERKKLYRLSSQIWI